MNPLELARPELLALKGYSSARKESQGGRVFLNANESPWQNSQATGLNRYPEPQPEALYQQLANLYEVPRANLLIGRGSDEAIDLLVRGFCRAGVDSIVITPPTFGMYSVSAGIQNAGIISVGLDSENCFTLDTKKVLAAVTEFTKIIFLCSPNNPSGALIPRSQVLEIVQALQGKALVILDEAYIEFSGVPSMAKDATTLPNLAVLRTLSKAHALASARLGCLIADVRVIEFLSRLMAPYPLPQPTIDAGLKATCEPALSITAEHIQTIISERSRLSLALAKLDCVIAVLPSAANFICLRFKDPLAAFEKLKGTGVIVRDVRHYPGLSDCLRISIGLPEENDEVISILSKLEKVA